MPKFFIIATCQTQSLVLLTQNMVPGAVVEGMNFLDHTFYRSDALAHAQHCMDEADFIFIQHGGFGPYNQAPIKAAHPTKTFSLATIYFRGLHPDSCYIGSIGDNFQDPSLYHSLAVVEAFRQGRSEKWAVHHALTFDNFERLGLLNAWDSSLDEVRRREQGVQFPIAALIESYCHKQQGFLSFNHPTLALLHLYMQGVFTWLGLPVRPMNLAEAQDPLTLHDLIPVYDFVAAHYGLPYRTTQHWMLAHTKKFMDRETYIRSCYESYRQCDPTKLVVDSPPDMIAALRANPKLAFLAPTLPLQDKGQNT